MPVAPRAHTSTNPITTAAEIMADGGPEEVWRFALRKLVANETGHCAGCPSTPGSPVRPCAMHVIATKAAHLTAATRTPR